MPVLTRGPAKENAHPAVKVVRFAAGRELDGIPRTDARWTKPGVKPLTPQGYASRWHHYTHARRAGIRLGLVFAFVLLVCGIIVSPTNTDDTMRVVVWAVMATVVWMIAEKSRRWSHFHTYIAPTANALADMLGMPRRMDPRLWVHVPTGHRTNPDKVVVIDLPPTYHAPTAQQKRLVEVAAKRLSMSNPDWEVDWEGDHPRLLMRACPEPPERVSFEQVRALAENAPLGEYVLGLGSRLVSMLVSLAGDSPHILASIGSGGGKSMFGKWMALQAIARGHRVVIIDIVKRGASHKWAKGVDGVEIYRHPDTAHTALINLAELVEQRCESYWHRGNNGTDQQILLIIEESNRTLRKLQSHWGNDLDGTKTSPAVLAIEGILCVGREAGVNAVTVGQRMSAQASGGGDARENYGVRLGNRFSRQTARMLFGDVNPLPASSNHPGRVQVVIGTRATEVQLPYLPDDDPAPLEWALARRRELINTPCGLGNGVVHDTTSDTHRLTLVASNKDPETAPDDGLASLSDAARKIGVDVIALRNARARDPEFPGHHRVAGRAKLYRVAELQAWADNRAQRSTGSESS